MFVFTSTNPCNCHSSVIPSSDPCDDTCNCLQLCDIIIASNSDEAVAQCGGELILDLTDPQYENDLCACGESTQKWYLASYDTDVFASASLTIDGDLNLVKVDDEIDILHSDIIIYFVCGNLSYYFTIKVGIANPCSTIICAPDQTCSNCGDLEDHCVDNVDIGVG
jgi:hypothetical protein